jgi:hypothetical protein
MTHQAHLDGVREYIDDKLVDSAWIGQDVVNFVRNKCGLDLKFACDILACHLALKYRKSL